MKVSSVQEMRDLDARAVEAYGLPDHLLMENAGQAVYYVILRELGVRNRRFAVFCGPGNNGGDGLVVARKLHSTGGRVRVFLLGDPEAYRGPARSNLEILRRAGGGILVKPGIEDVSEFLDGCDAVVDGILGTGVTREVGGELAGIIRRINDSGKRVFSIDIPSGVDGDTGQPRGVAIQADATITFGLPKRGNLLLPGIRLGGRLYVSHISFPPELLSGAPIEVSLNEPAELPTHAPMTPDEEPESPSRSLLIVAGDSSRLGPPTLTAVSFLQVGSGVAWLAVPRSAELSLPHLPRGISLAPQDETDAGTLALSSLDCLLWLAQRVSLVVVGHGFADTEETRELARRFLDEVERPVILDGETAEALEGDGDLFRRREEATVILVDARELARLASRSASEVLEDPLKLVQETGGKLASTILLLEGQVLVGLPDQRAFINVTGSPEGPAEGWSDVLAGIIGAMHSLGMPLEAAVRTGVFLHGLADEDAGRIEVKGHASVESLIQCLPLALDSLKSEVSAFTTHYHGVLEVI
jgi:ADP-dependent NAD(P)H-hydrate dehydratase / NAD(P)H-hydrate epimerase